MVEELFREIFWSERESLYTYNLCLFLSVVRTRFSRYLSYSERDANRARDEGILLNKDLIRFPGLPV